MNEMLLKDEIQNMHARLEDKKQQLEVQLADISKADVALASLKTELANMHRQFNTEMTGSVEEKKEKVKG